MSNKKKAKPREKLFGEGIFRSLKEIRVEKFLIDELERYIKLHKEHEKEIKYIG